MSISVEQAKAFDAVARLGSFAAAAKELGKAHTGIVYSLKTLEQSLSLELLDRSGYRSSITEAGKRVLQRCQNILNEVQYIDEMSESLAGGREASLSIVYDGIMPVEYVVDSAAEIQQSAPFTKVSIQAAYLADVEKVFSEQQADIMLSIIPAAVKTGKLFRSKQSLMASLVAHRDHPLVKNRRAVSEKMLQEYTYLTVQSSDQRLNMSTTHIEKCSTFFLSDFHAKKYSLLKNIGYGWMPDHMIDMELKQKQLVKIRWEGANIHRYDPVIYSRTDFLQPVAKQFVDLLMERIG